MIINFLLRISGFGFGFGILFNFLQFVYQKSTIDFRFLVSENLNFVFRFRIFLSNRISKISFWFQNILFFLFRIRILKGDCRFLFQKILYFNFGFRFYKIEFRKSIFVFLILENVVFRFLICVLKIGFDFLVWEKMNFVLGFRFFVFRKSDFENRFSFFGFRKFCIVLSDSDLENFRLLVSENFVSHYFQNCF